MALRFVQEIEWVDCSQYTDKYTREIPSKREVLFIRVKLIIPLFYWMKNLIYDLFKHMYNNVSIFDISNIVPKSIIRRSSVVL